ncbi:MAG: hypothetical protein H0U74_15125 [Bradymonadaceae bacterium]|nr:hypothetical protein [Lujinxingiaceae bacterium]
MPTNIRMWWCLVFGLVLGLGLSACSSDLSTTRSEKDKSRAQSVATPDTGSSEGQLEGADAEIFWDSRHEEQLAGERARSKSDRMGEGESDQPGPSECWLFCERVGACASEPSVSLEACEASCERSLEEGILRPRELACAQVAPGCVGVEHCLDDLEVCDEACDAAMGCELFEDPMDCRRWCGSGVADGALDIVRIECVVTHERQMQCSQIDELCLGH